MDHDPDYHNPRDRRRKRGEGVGGASARPQQGHGRGQGHRGRRPARQAGGIAKEAGPMRPGL